MRAMTMFGRAEERVSDYIIVWCHTGDTIIQYNDLMKKKKIVENDKAKIEALIIELDEKKNAAIQGAFQQVNKVCTCTHSVIQPLRVFKVYFTTNCF